MTKKATSALPLSKNALTVLERRYLKRGPDRNNFV